MRSQRPSSPDKEMQGRHVDELGNFPHKSILTGLHIILGKRCKISLCVAPYSYCIGRMVGSRILLVHASFGSAVPMLLDTPTYGIPP
jgi:hypothetical protein